MSKCKYNSGVDCEPNSRHCKTCGWAPDVAMRRKAAYKSGEQTKTKRQSKGKTCANKVAKINADGRVVAVYKSTNEAGQANGLSASAVKYRCDGRKVKLDDDGYTYRFLEDVNIDA